VVNALGEKNVMVILDNNVSTLGGAAATTMAMGSSATGSLFVSARLVYKPWLKVPLAGLV